MQSVAVWLDIRARRKVMWDWELCWLVTARNKNNNYCNNKVKLMEIAAAVTYAFMQNTNALST